MKVLQVNKLYYPWIGGVETHVRDLVLELRDKVEVSVLTANTAPRTVQETVDGVPVRRLASFGVVRSTPVAPSFPLWLRRLKADIRHFHFPYPVGELSYLLASPEGKLVVTYHSDIVRQKLLLRLYRPFLRAFLRRADAIFVSSPQMADHSEDLVRVRHKCLVVPFGIDTAELEATSEIEAKAASLRAKYGANAEPIVLFVGRLIYYKGLEYLVRAMPFFSGKVVLVGEGPLEPTLRTLASELGVSERLVFAGGLPGRDLVAHYHACDLFVLPSIERSEAFGLVQLEAQACGKPVISTSLPTGVPFANLDGVTGLVVPPRDPEALGQAVSRLLSDRDFREQLGRQGKERVEREFTRRRMGERVLEIYGNLLAGKRPLR